MLSEQSASSVMPAVVGNMLLLLPASPRPQAPTCLRSQVFKLMLVNPLHDSREHQVHVCDPLIQSTQELLPADQLVMM